MFVNKIKELADTTRISIDKSVSLYENEFCGNRYNLPNINFKKINHISFDIEQARHELNKLQEKIPLINYPVSEKKSRYYYKGMSLTAFKDDEDKLSSSFFIYDKENNRMGNEFYVGAQKEKIYDLKPEVSSDFVETEACSNFFSSILEKFKLRPTRVRLLELLPGGIIPPHIDYPYTYGIKLHAFLSTNDEVWNEVYGEKFQIPSDGYFYWMDISKPHSVINLGNTSRITLCVNLNPLEKDEFRGKSIDYILENI